MSATDLLTRLDYVKQIREGQWRARCPAHAGKSTDSLSAAETADGTVLVRCFGGCDARAIVEAVGLSLADLFPAGSLTRDQKRDYTRRKTEREIREALRHELWVLAQCNDAHLEGWPLHDPDPAGRECLAVSRIHAGFEVLYGG